MGYIAFLYFGAKPQSPSSSGKTVICPPVGRARAYLDPCSCGWAWSWAGPPSSRESP
ncbi:MAG TPA: hypothetical protein VKM55_12215 [Candidatus Lokiarchaeia archaeon]|nr:hypothetical protein [Candidatus Lokiarchaeia archaeon]